MVPRIAGHALIGRDQELRRIGGLLDDLPAGRPTVLMLQGPPGSGRTRLLDETARLARARRMTVFAEPEWSGAVGSQPNLTRSGRRSFSASASFSFKPPLGLMISTPAAKRS